MRSTDDIDADYVFELFIFISLSSVLCITTKFSDEIEIAGCTAQRTTLIYAVDKHHDNYRLIPAHFY